MDENKRKHLEFIQDVISRLGRNSFMLKSLMALQVAAFVAFLARGSNDDIADAATNLALLVVVVSIFPFWLLDGYFLRQERLFRALYDHVRILDEDKIDFSMDTSGFSKGGMKEWLPSVFSVTLWTYYIFILLIIGLAFLVITFLT